MISNRKLLVLYYYVSLQSELTEKKTKRGGKLEQRRKNSPSPTRPTTERGSHGKSPAKGRDQRRTEGHRLWGPDGRNYRRIAAEIRAERKLTATETEWEIFFPLSFHSLNVLSPEFRSQKTGHVTPGGQSVGRRHTTTRQANPFACKIVRRHLPTNSDNVQLQPQVDWMLSERSSLR